LTFGDVLAQLGSLFCYRARLNFQAFSLGDMMAARNAVAFTISTFPIIQLVCPPPPPPTKKTFFSPPPPQKKKNLHDLCYPFRPQGINVVPRETEDNAYAKFWGANKVYYGACGNDE